VIVAGAPADQWDRRAGYRVSTPDDVLRRRREAIYQHQQHSVIALEQIQGLSCLSSGLASPGLHIPAYPEMEFEAGAAERDDADAGRRPRRCGHLPRGGAAGDETGGPDLDENTFPHLAQVMFDRSKDKYQSAVAPLHRLRRGLATGSPRISVDAVAASEPSP
jgi:hypothetical protein